MCVNHSFKVSFRAACLLTFSGCISSLKKYTSPGVVEEDSWNCWVGGRNVSLQLMVVYGTLVSWSGHVGGRTWYGVTNVIFSLMGIPLCTVGCVEKKHTFSPFIFLMTLSLSL